ncbi:hypothetical protein ABPG72_021072 [Tetrahymena utriculariae]
MIIQNIHGTALYVNMIFAKAVAEILKISLHIVMSQNLQIALKENTVIVLVVIFVEQIINNQLGIVPHANVIFVKAVANSTLKFEQQIDKQINYKKLTHLKEYLNQLINQLIQFEI